MHRSGWGLVRVEEDIASGAKADRRGMIHAPSRPSRAERWTASWCCAWIAAAVLSRTSDACSSASRRGLARLEIGIDPSTPAGEMTATVVAAMAQMERRLIGQRTKDALAVKRAEGGSGRMAA